MPTAADLEVRREESGGLVGERGAPLSWETTAGGGSSKASWRGASLEPSVPLMSAEFPGVGRSVGRGMVAVRCVVLVTVRVERGRDQNVG